MDVIGCHAVDTVIYDSGGGIRPIEHACFSSSHLFSLIALPPLPSSLLPACFKQSPALGRGRSQRIDDLQLRAGCRFACFPSCRAALSLSLACYCRPVIGRLAIVAPMSSPPFLSTRLFRHRPRRPSRLRVMSSPSLAPPLLVDKRGGIRAGYVMLGCSAVVACLSHAVSPPRAIWFSPRLVPVASCGLASTHVPTGSCGAVRSPCLLPRLSVSIVFKMLPYQSFKTLRLFDMVLICEYRGVVPHPVVSPSHLIPSRRFRADCLRLLRRRPSIPCRSRRSRFSSFSSLVQYDRRGGSSGRPSACSTGRRTGLAVSS